LLQVGVLLYYIDKWCVFTEQQLGGALIWAAAPGRAARFCVASLLLDMFNLWCCIYRLLL
jgi:hypothetical protein